MIVITKESLFFDYSMGFIIWQLAPVRTIHLEDVSLIMYYIYIYVIIIYYIILEYYYILMEAANIYV